MRLYVNTNEVPFLKDVLKDGIARTNDPIKCDRLCELLERVEICDQLQSNIKRSVKGSDDGQCCITLNGGYNDIAGVEDPDEV